MKPVILGSGLAGLSAALALAPMPVILVSPYALGKGCSSAWAQGGIAAALGAKDSAAIVKLVTEEAFNVIQRLIDAGTVFDRDAQGQLMLGLEAAHSQHRIVHAKDATGRVITEALIKAARVTPSITIIENATARELLIEDGTIAGVALSRQGEEIILSTASVILATGGAAALWRDTTNPLGNWGSGLALAARAGALLGDLEFMQFHPTAIAAGCDPMPLASESLRGEGCVLIDEKNERFTDELQPRDIVARAIWAHIAQGHQTFLDARTKVGQDFAERFPTIFKLCTEAGIDPTRDPIPVRPAAHYHMGGVVTDAQGRTTIPGLWACGEVACTRLHGANRLASNSLLEAAVFGGRVAQDIKNLPLLQKREATPMTLGHTDARRRIPPYAGMTHEEAAQIRTTISDYVGVIRDKKGLEKALAQLSPLAKKSDMALMGLLIASSALKREESRGAHFRSDFLNTQKEGQASVFRLTDLENF